MTDNYLAAAIEIAREAGAILREESHHPAQISYKREVDLVTQADKRSEKLIVERLTKYFPTHAITAEEGSGHESTSEFRWHVDPLDGTTNFAHGYPCFCVSIALAQQAGASLQTVANPPEVSANPQHGENVAGQKPQGSNPVAQRYRGPEPRDTLLCGVVYDPIHEELFAAARGEGATLNGAKINVSRNATVAASLLCTGFPVHERLASPNIHYYSDFTMRSHGVRRDGSAALDLANVACGRFDGFWEFGLKKWDTAAGVLLIQEAGGRVSDFAGRPYELGGPVILATNGLIHEEMRAVANEIAVLYPGPTLPR
jgi:myo-inositol-1(or 4)-monophosphatase